MPPRPRGIEFLHGVEISAQFEELEIHVVGLGIAPACAELVEALAGRESARAKRAAAMVERLNALGVPVDAEKVSARGRGAVGRIHIAQEIRELGFTQTVQQGFDKYIGKGRPAYEESPRVPCADAVELIHKAEGLAFIGHPGIGGAWPNSCRGFWNSRSTASKPIYTHHKPGHYQPVH